MKKMVWMVVVAMVAVQSYGAMLNKGVRELSVAGSIDKTDEMNVMVSGRGGYFLMDFVEVGVGAGVSWLEGGDVTTYTGGVFGEYNLPLEALPTVVPFCGAAASVTHVSIEIGDFEESDTAVEGAAYGGAKYYLVDNLCLALQATVMVASEDIYMGEDEMEAFDWVLSMVTRFFF